MSVEIVTFGCRLNAFESEVIAREAERRAHRYHRHQQLRGHQRGRGAGAAVDPAVEARAAAARIVVTGCAAQTQPKMFAGMVEVDRVVGNDDKMRIEAWREARSAFDGAATFGIEASEKIVVADIMAVKTMAPHLVEGFQNGVPRVFVQVQNGCDHRCTFCIIPYGRGNSRSVPMGAVVDQVRALVEPAMPRSC